MQGIAFGPTIRLLRQASRDPTVLEPTAGLGIAELRAALAEPEEETAAPVVKKRVEQLELFGG